MSRTCEITGKKTISGNKISHSQAKTKRTFKANLQTKKLINPATGQKMRIKLSTSALRTLRKWQTLGKAYDLRELIKNAK